MGPARGLAQQLANRFSVHAYDRRGRRASGPGAAPSAFDREVEDLVAVLEAAGAPAQVLGVSSGATLALEAARQGAPIDRLAVHESPSIVDGTHHADDPRLQETVRELVVEGRRAEPSGRFFAWWACPPPSSR